MRINDKNEGNVSPSTVLFLFAVAFMVLLTKFDLADMDSFLTICYLYLLFKFMVSTKW